MAKKRTQKSEAVAPETLTLEFDGEHISDEQFLRVCSSFLKLIREVVKSITGSSRAVRTDVSVAAGSVQLTATLRPHKQYAAYRFASPILEGMEQLEARTGVAPRYFNRNALGYAQRMSTALIGQGALKRIGMRNGKGSAKDVTPQTYATVDNLLGAKYQSDGSVEGILRTISDEGQGVRFYVYHHLNGDKIACNISPEQEVAALSLFKKRVVVYGKVSYAKDGFPISIVVRDFEELPAFENLPPLDRFAGILA